MDAPLDLAEFHRPWLASGIVALITNAPVKQIRTWTDRGMVPDVLPAEGRALGRRYSVADAVLLMGMHYAFEAGAAPANASFVGETAVTRAEELIADHGLWGENPSDAIDLGDSVDFFTFEGDEPRHMHFEVAALRNPKAVTPLGSSRPPGSSALMMVRLDELIGHVLEEAPKVSEDLNRRALEGRLKPFPEALR